MDFGYFVAGDSEKVVQGQIGKKAPILGKFVGYSVGYLFFPK